MGGIPFSPSLLMLFDIPLPPETVFILIPLAGMLTAVAIVAIVFWYIARQKELQAHQQMRIREQEMRIREMEHQRKMKELELEIEKAKAGQRVA
jgi:uncharacterized protein HemX